MRTRTEGTPSVLALVLETRGSAQGSGGTQRQSLVRTRMLLRCLYMLRRLGPSFVTMSINAGWLCQSWSRIGGRAVGVSNQAGTQCCIQGQHRHIVCLCAPSFQRSRSRSCSHRVHAVGMHG